jgi:Na+/H+-dicarboxylate symporter
VWLQGYCALSAMTARDLGIEERAALSASVCVCVCACVCVCVCMYVCVCVCVCVFGEKRGRKGKTE